jgi:phosphate acyltransferase
MARNKLNEKIEHDLKNFHSRRLPVKVDADDDGV